jgi:hypothetical protein
MPACQAGGRGFESLLRRQRLPVSTPAIVKAQIAQSVEQRTENPCVAGSIPALGTKRVLSESAGSTFYMDDTIHKASFNALFPTTLAKKN